MSAIAAAAGLSRPTLYAHFPDRGELLEAVLARTVLHVSAAITAARPHDGLAPDALQRLVSTSWQELARHEELAQGFAAEVSPEAMHRAHGSAREVIGALVDRGVHDQAFRTDLSRDWLITSFLALVHAATQAVRAGELDADAALAHLRVTVHDVFTARGR